MQQVLCVVLVTGSLSVLAVSLVFPIRHEQTRPRVERFLSALSADASYRSDQMGFWFDPEFVEFLDDVDRRTSRTATVAVLVPSSPDLYQFQANYRLAPRRVVDAAREDEADVVAAYRPQNEQARRGFPITNGRLWVRARQ